MLLFSNHGSLFGFKPGDIKFVNFNASDAAFQQTCHVFATQS